MIFVKIRKLASFPIEVIAQSNHDPLHCKSSLIPLVGMSEIKAQLMEELAPMDWETLIPHAKRDALIVVDSALDLVEVGVAIAEDRVNSVQNWISELLIRKPFSEELTVWNQNPNQEFETLIVQPFVLISPLQTAE